MEAALKVAIFMGRILAGSGLCQDHNMLIAFLAIATTHQQQPEVRRISSLTGDITVLRDFESKNLGNKRNISIYLPPDYKTSPGRRYPVLYCHDGQNVFDGATSYVPNKEWRIDEAAEALIKAGLIQPIIIVAIDNGQMERGNEYLPTKIKMGNNEFGGKADLYGRFLLEEVKAYIDKTYRTKPDASNTALLGSSLGGVVTYYLGITHADKFSLLGVISPSVWVNNREMIKRTEALPKKLKLRIWIDMGTQEGSDSVRDANDLFLGLQKKGWKPGKELVFYKDGFAQHNEEAWARRVPAILLWMFGTGK
jgi:predicted alpha/beta superfamily hydrolase